MLNVFWDSFFSGGGNRYDYWRVAVDLAGSRPTAGYGIDNFGPQYLQRRRTPKAPVYAHSLWFEALGDLGIPGLGFRDGEITLDDFEWVQLSQSQQITVSCAIEFPWK